MKGSKLFIVLTNVGNKMETIKDCFILALQYFIKTRY